MKFKLMPKANPAKPGGGSEVLCSAGDLPGGATADRIGNRKSEK